MACLSPSRICARVQDKLLCHFGHKVQVRRQTVFVKLKPPGPSPLRIFGKTCQRVTTCGPACGSAGGAPSPPRRAASSLQSTSTGSLPDYGTQIVDPYRLLEDDLTGIYEDIRSTSVDSGMFVVCGYVTDLPPYDCRLLYVENPCELDTDSLRPVLFL
ncbi:unnamed protein product [Plutella xylostella]|uniref:(diamondback moth) hypothetical protein n=1 Tax=Plutella xylostella TaxID=51655 RepID=A0A8S4FWR5_PLUXY|nr:unnamed protein product [Plutella xylostella]